MSDDLSPKPPAGDPTLTPFNELLIDPRQTPEDITEVMQEMAEEAHEDERRTLQGMWRKITLHPEERLVAAFFSHAAPASKPLPNLGEMDAKALLRRFPFKAPSSNLLPDVLTSYEPTTQDLLLLPPLLLTPSSKATLQNPEWPDIDPDEDDLFRL